MARRMVCQKKISGFSSTVFIHYLKDGRNVWAMAKILDKKKLISFENYVFLFLRKKKCIHLVFLSIVINQFPRGKNYTKYATLGISMKIKDLECFVLRI